MTMLEAYQRHCYVEGVSYYFVVASKHIQELQVAYTYI